MSAGASSVLKCRETRLPPAASSSELKGIEILFFAVGWILFAVFIATTAASAVLRWFFPSHRFPWLEVCVFLLVALGIAGQKLWTVKRKLDRLKPRRRGERCVAAKLEELRPLGYLVLHDLSSATTEKDNHFNIDHVVVGPAGVFAIETRTWSRPIGENPKLVLRGERLVRNDRPLHPARAKAPEQARNVRVRVAQILKAATGRDFPVSAVLAVPGWWVEEHGNTAGMLLLNPKRIEAVLKMRPQVLNKQETSLAPAQLQAHGRAAMQAKT